MTCKGIPFCNFYQQYLHTGLNDLEWSFKQPRKKVTLHILGLSLLPVFHQTPPQLTHVILFLRHEVHSFTETFGSLISKCIILDSRPTCFRRCKPLQHALDGNIPSKCPTSPVPSRNSFVFSRFTWLWEQRISEIYYSVFSRMLSSLNYQHWHDFWQ